MITPRAAVSSNSPLRASVASAVRGIVPVVKS
jgi:hypothetical protein